MKNIVIALCLFAFSGYAQTVVVADFSDGSYTDGDLAGQNGWTLTQSAGSRINIASGQAVLTAGQTGDDLYKAFPEAVTPISGQSLLTTVVFAVTTPTFFGDYFVHLSDPAGTTTLFFQRLYVKSFEEGFVLGLLDYSAGSTVVYGTDKLTLGLTYAAEILWNFIEGNNNDTFSLLVDGAPYLQRTWTSTLAEPTNLAAVNLRQGGTNSTPGLVIDELSIVMVPEPGILALLSCGLGLASFLAARKVVRRPSLSSGNHLQV